MSLNINIFVKICQMPLMFKNINFMYIYVLNNTIKLNSNYHLQVFLMPIVSKPPF